MWWWSKDVRHLWSLRRAAAGPTDRMVFGAVRRHDTRWEALRARCSKQQRRSRGTTGCHRSLSKTFGKLPVTLRFIVEGEDGLGSPSLYRFTAENPELLQANGCLWDEGSSDTRENPVVSLGFKGITFLELRAFGARSDLHSKWGTIVPNPAWRLVQALATITSPQAVITFDAF